LSCENKVDHFFIGSATNIFSETGLLREVIKGKGKIVPVLK